MTRQPLSPRQGASPAPRFLAPARVCAVISRDSKALAGELNAEYRNTIDRVAEGPEIRGPLRFEPDSAATYVRRPLICRAPKPSRAAAPVPARATMSQPFALPALGGFVPATGSAAATKVVLG